MDLLNELDKLISRNNESSTGNSDFQIPLDVLLRQPDGNNVTSIEVGGQFVRSVPEVVAILVAYSIVIILSLFGNSLVSTLQYNLKIGGYPLGQVVFHVYPSLRISLWISLWILL